MTTKEREASNVRRVLAAVPVLREDGAVYVEDVQDVCNLTYTGAWIALSRAGFTVRYDPTQYAYRVW